MEQKFEKYVSKFFRKFVETYNFRTKVELNDGNSYMIEYDSSFFVVKIEKYFREFYVTLYKATNPDNEINLFNLLEYLKRADEGAPKSNYFREEKDTEECYRKQLNHISTVLYENYTLINDFFSSNDCELRAAEFEKYWNNKHPELYNKS